MRIVSFQNISVLSPIAAISIDYDMLQTGEVQSKLLSNHKEPNWCSDCQNPKKVMQRHKRFLLVLLCMRMLKGVSDSCLRSFTVPCAWSHCSHNACKAVMACVHIIASLLCICTVLL